MPTIALSFEIFTGPPPPTRNYLAGESFPIPASTTASPFGPIGGALYPLDSVEEDDYELDDVVDPCGDPACTLCYEAVDVLPAPKESDDDLIEAALVALDDLDSTLCDLDVRLAWLDDSIAVDIAQEHLDLAINATAQAQVHMARFRRASPF